MGPEETVFGDPLLVRCQNPDRSARRANRSERRSMKKKTSPHKRNGDRDTMRLEYGFSTAVLLVTAEAERRLSSR
jgi:hypothetical protein